MRLYALLCQEVGTRPEDRRLLRELSRSCALPFSMPVPRRFQAGAPTPSAFLQAASLALLAFAAIAAAARCLA